MGFLRSVGRVYRDRGLPGVARAISRRAARPFRYWTNNSVFFGHIVEWRGNQARLHGCVFEVSSPHIATALKSRFFFGTYEAESIALVRQYLPRDLPVVEFGGCIGVVSCVANRMLQDPTQHVVVEAHPELVEVLRKNAKMNGAAFKICHAALAYSGERVAFWINPTHFVGNSLRGSAGRKQVEVPTVTLSKLLEARGFERFSLVVDVEGAEIELVAHEIALIRERVDTLIVELHPAEWGAGEIAIEEMVSSLLDNGFREARRLGSDRVYVNTRFHAS